jgi:acyl-CoA hydrolase
MRRSLGYPSPEAMDKQTEVTGKPVSASRVTVSRLMQPMDANPAGNVHGGVILRLMDEAGGVVATRHCRSRTVTAAIDSFSFLSPVYVGNLVTVKASINWVGRSSMEVGVHVEAEELHSGRVTQTASGYLVYACLDDQGRPAPAPPLLPETDEDRRRMAEAEERQRARLKVRKRGG